MIDGKRMRAPAVFVAMLLCNGVALADLEPRHVVHPSADKAKSSAAQTTSEAALALTKGDFRGALAGAERAISVDAHQPWAHYVRAEALVGLGRIDDALPEYRLAEHAVAKDDRWSRSIVLWGRANTFYQAGRCNEAKAAFTDYIALVKKDDHAAAEMAQAHIDGCKVPWVNPFAAPPAKPTSPTPPPAP
jgi:Tfp pilus assembly protein PilF